MGSVRDILVIQDPISNNKRRKPITIK